MRGPRPGRTGIVTAGLTVAVLATAGADLLARGSKAELASRWRDRDIVIDGVNSEWQGTMVAVKGAPLSMGVFNDDQFVYLCLVTGSRSAAGQIHRQGLIVWLDQAGGKKKQFGLEFPIPMRGMSVVDRTGETGETRGAWMPLEADRQRVAILGPGKNDRTDIALGDLKGIAVKVADADGVLVYELRMPLLKSADVPYAAGIRPGRIVRVSVETPELRAPAGRGVMGPGRGGGGRGPGGGFPGVGGRGGMGGMGGRGGAGGGGREGGRGGFDMPKPIKFSTTVQLATAR